MYHFFSTFITNSFKCFSYKNLKWHILMIAGTYILVMSGFDWYYFSSSRNTTFQTFIMPAIILGGILPIILPIILLFVGKIRKNKRIITTAWALAQAVTIGSFLSSFYKTFTGRVPPPHSINTGTFVDISHIFQFGFLRGGVFWGWPSSHTTIAFAMATTLLTLYPTKKKVLYPSFLYALYVGLGVSISIHWFSDFAAGAILGTVIGTVVGASFHLASKQE